MGGGLSTNKRSRITKKKNRVRPHSKHRKHKRKKHFVSNRGKRSARLARGTSFVDLVAKQRQDIPIIVLPPAERHRNMYMPANWYSFHNRIKIILEARANEILDPDREYPLLMAMDTKRTNDLAAEDDIGQEEVVVGEE